MKRNSTITLLLIAAHFISACGKDETKDTSTQSKDLAILSISNSPKYDFGFQIVDSVSEKEFTVTNVGSLAATRMTGSFYLSLSFNFKGGNYPGVGGTCRDLLTSHSSCTVIVVFTPKFYGAVQSSLAINHNNGVSDTVANGPYLAGQGN